MSAYYKGKRIKNIFDPESKKPFAISRSKLDLFLVCPRCFYLDRRLGVGQPPGYPFNLNNAVDALLKKEFDVHRKNNTPHPIMLKYKVDAVPFFHERLDEWRDSRTRGLRYLHTKTNLEITGGVDDLWINNKKELIVVDYKATSKKEEVSLDADWQDGYKRQMEIYQWLLRKMGYKVSNTGYFVYCNGRADADVFDGKLEFDIKLLPYKGDDGWVEDTVVKAKKCLMGKSIPKSGSDCDFCLYREMVAEVSKYFFKENI